MPSRACTQWGDALDVVTAERPAERPPPVRQEETRVRRLREMKRRAGGLLLAVTAAFVVVTLVGHGRGWSAWLQSALEAAMVGGVADWFAVTALFRHPLGVPIPHTAIIRERKDQFGETLGEFIQDSFLTPDTIVARVTAARISSRLSAWLCEPANAERLGMTGAERAQNFPVMSRQALSFL